MLGNIPQHYGLGVSLFSRLLKFYNQHKLPVAVLSTMYCCHEAIVSLARSLSSSDDLHSNSCHTTSIPGVPHPIWFVCSSLERTLQSDVTTDSDEAKELIGYLNHFFKDLKQSDGVCIMATSRNQVS